ncbi:MAG: hypothetical protein ACOYMF_10110 [Bacteroidales bacterium]
MKNKFKMLLIAACLITAPSFILAQTPPHPNNGNAPNTGGTGNGPVGGGAAIGSGLSILLAMSAAYGFRKFYQKRCETSITE